MPETDFILMSLIIFLPTVFALGLLAFPRHKEEAMRWWALFGTALTLGVTLCAFVLYERQVVNVHIGTDDRAMTLAARVEAMDAAAGHDHATGDFVARYPWIPHFNIHYYLGADGISMALVLLTAVLSFLAMIASWRIDRYVKGYCMLFLLLETGMLGTFLALDFFLFYIFWEVMLLPMYFLIGVWGGPRREYAAIKFFLYTLLGSVFILIAMLGFYFTDVRDFVNQNVVADRVAELRRDNPNLTAEQAEDQAAVNTFDIILLQKVGRQASALIHRQGVEPEGLREARQKLADAEKGGAPEQVAVAQKRVADAEGRLKQWFFQPWFQYTMFLLLLIGFAIKVPVFPFHTWLPDAHVEAP
ncbi:MAG TPA: proton-conducting transporter membrane subunit, partial [Gemmataceae bacterium]|nr:proton-conducting transporter membrane subunit [Gemmataceae bacterium]